MALESRDINDGSVIEATKIAQSQNGAVQFSITLPSGRELVSEWIAEDKRREARDIWIATVRNEMVADADQKREEARKAATAQRLRQEATPTNTGALHTEPAYFGPTKQTAFTPDTPTSAGAISTSPDDFIRQSLQQAQRDVAYWQGVASGAAAEWKKAQENLDKWTALASALGAKEIPNDKQVQNSSGSNSAGSSRPRRGRPAGSKNKPKPEQPVYDGDNGHSAD